MAADGKGHAGEEEELDGVGEQPYPISANRFIGGLGAVSEEAFTRDRKGMITEGQIQD